MAISVGSVSVDVVPNASRFAEQLRTQIVPQAGTLGEEIGRQIADRIAASIRNGIQNGLQGGQPGAQGAQAGNSYGDEFSRVVKTKIEAALRSLPEVQIGVATSEAEQKLRDLHVRLEELRNQRIGVDIDAKDALAEVEKIKVKLNELAHKSPDIQVRVDAARAVAELAAVKAEVDKLDRKHADVKVDSSAASAGISGLVAGIAAIGPALIPIAAVATAGLGAVGLVAVAGAAGVGVLALALHGVSAAVTAVNAEQASAATDAKAYATAQASAAAAVQGAQASLANAVSSADNSSISSAQAVKTARTTLADAITSADNSTISSAEAVQKAQTGLANAITTADNSAISSAQAVQNARTGLAKAIESADNATINSQQAVETAHTGLAKAIESADNAAISSAQAVEKARTGVAKAIESADNATISSAQAVQNARTALDNANTTADNAAISSAQAVQTARVGLANAIATANNAAISSAEAVANAQQALDDATRSAAISVTNAVQAEENAERTLAQALQQEQVAQDALTVARKTAQQQIEDLTLSVQDGALSQRAANLAVETSKIALDKVLANPASSKLQREQAQLTYDQAVQHVKDLGVQQDRLHIKQAQAVQAGVDGSAVVVTAQDRIATSVRAVETAQDNVAKTAAAVAEAQRAGLEKIGNAQLHLADSQRAQDEQARTSAQSVAAAQQTLSNATRAQGVQAETSARAVAAAQQAVTNALRAQEVQARTSAESVTAAQQAVSNALRAQEQQAKSSAESVAAAQQSVTNAIRAQGVQAKSSAESVTAAQQSVTNALRAQEVQAASSAQAVTTAQQGVTDAIRAQGVQAASSAQSIEKAQEGITNALRAQEQQAVSSAASVAAAQLALENAQRAQKTAAEQVSSSAQAAEKALAALTPAGRDFVTFITGTMQPALKRLQETAAAGLLPGLQSGLAALLPIMPIVNDAVGKIARTMGDLFREAGKALDTPFYRQFITFIGDEGSKTLGTFGQIIGNLATGFFGLVQAFAPFADAIGGGLLRLSKKFADFGTNVDPNSPLQKFIAYVKEVGPTVLDTFNQLGIFVGHIVEALAPFGFVVLKVADYTATLINKLGPTGLLAALAAVTVGLDLVTGGLKVTAGGVALATGGLSLVIPAIVLVVALFAQLYSSNKGFADLIKNDVLPVLKDFGSNVLEGLKSAFNQIVDAVRPNLPQFELLGKLIGALILGVIAFVGLDLGLVFKGLGFVVASFVYVIGDLVKGFQFLALRGAETLAELSKVPGFGWAKDAAVVLADLGTGYTGAATAGDQATKSAEATKKAQEDLTGASKKLNDEVQKSIDKFTILREGGLSVARSADALAESQAALTKSVNDNGASLDSNTVAGRANRKAVDDVASSLNDKVTADFKATQATQGTDAALRQASDTTEANRQTLIKNFEQTGFSRQAAEDYTSKLLLTPAEVATNFKTPALGTAQTDVEKLQATVNALQDKTINIKVLAGYDALASTGLSTGASTYGKAEGGIMDFFANGGLRENHVAQIAPAGSMRVWAEPETGGESYIPLAASKRDRSLSIWQETGKRLNAFADGGLVDQNSNVPNSGSQPNVGAVDHTVTVNVQPDFTAMQSGLTGFIKDIGPHLASVFAPPEVAGGVTWPAMFSIIRGQFPWALDNSDVRPGDPGYHGKGEALDVGAPGDNPAQLLEADQWIGANFPGSAELIHLGGINIKNGRDVGDGFGLYGAATMNAHGNHVHWASAVDPNAERTPGPHLGVPAGSGNYTGPIPGGDAVGRWRGLVDSTLGELGLNVGLDDKVLRQIATESSGDPNATQGNIGDVNNASGDLARGLMQVIGTTFRSYAGPYAGLGQYDPHASIYAGLNYARATYGPDLSFLGQGHGYDSGGWLKPGDVGLNFTGRPEAVLTPEESAGLKAGMNSGGGKDVTINVHSQPGQSGEAIAGEVKRQLLFEMRG